MICNHCGEEIADGAKFCGNCGNKIEEETVKVTEETVEETAAEAVSEAEETLTEEVKEEKVERVFDAGDDDTVEPQKTVESKMGGFAEEPKKTEKNGEAFSIASLVCGILGILCCSCCGIGIILSIVAIVLGIISLNNNYDGRGLAIAGIACGGAGLLFGLPIIIGMFSSGASSASDISNIFSEFVDSL